MKTFLEPIGGSAPKFSAESTISNLIRHRLSSLALSCPAQGSPVPSFRSVYVWLTLTIARTHWKLSAQVLLCHCSWPEFPSWSQAHSCLSSPGLPRTSIQVGPTHLLNLDKFQLRLEPLVQNSQKSLKPQVLSDKASILCRLAAVPNLPLHRHLGRMFCGFETQLESSNTTQPYIQVTAHFINNNPPWFRANWKVCPNIQPGA